MMKILTLALLLPCLLQISVCSPNQPQPQPMRGMEVAESRGFLTSIRDFFGFGPRRSQAGAQKRERPPRPRPHRRPPAPPNFPGPRPQEIYLPHGHVQVPQYEHPNDNRIQVNVRHEGFTDPEEEVYGGQDSNYNIDFVSVNDVEFDPSEFTPPRPEDIIYSNDKTEQFQSEQPAFSQHHTREQHPNEGNFVSVHDKGSVFWPEDREVHDNDLNTNKHIGFSFPKPEDKVNEHRFQNTEKNRGISESFVTNDAYSNIANTHDFDNFDNSPKPFVETNSVKNSDDSSPLTSGSSDTFDGGFSNFFQSSFGFPTTKRPNIVFDLTTYVPPGFKRGALPSTTYSPPGFNLDSFPSATVRPQRFPLNGYSPPIYKPTTTKPPTTAANTIRPKSRKPYFNIAPEINKPKTNEPKLTSYVNNYNNDDTNERDHNNDPFDFQNTRKVNSTSFSEQIWHLPTKRPLPKISPNERQQNKYTINKAVSLLESTIRYDATTPTITTYKPIKVTQDISKTKRPDRLRVTARYTTKITTTTAKPRVTLPTLRPYIPPHGTPQRTRPPEIYKSIPKIVSHTTTPPPPPPPTTTSTTNTAATTTTYSTTYRPKRNPDPKITSQNGWKQPQNYNIAVTNNTKYYSNEKPSVSSFDDPFQNEFDTFVPFRNSDEFFQTIFGKENPLQQKPSDKEFTTKSPFKSGELIHQSSSIENPEENIKHGSSQFGRPLAPINNQQISFSSQRGPSSPNGVTKFIVSSDTTLRPSLQPTVKQHQNVHPQMRDHEAQRVITSKPRYTQYIRRGTTSSRPIAPVTELPKKAVTTNQEHGNQQLVVEGREQIHNGFTDNRVSNFPTKRPTRINLIKQTISTKNTANAPQLQIDDNNSRDIPKSEPHIKDEPAFFPFGKPMITSWNSQQSSHHRSSPSPNEQLDTQKYFTPQRYERPQPTLQPLQYTTHTREASPYTEYKALAQTSPEPQPVSYSQTSSEFLSQSVPVTISPPQGVIIENQFSKEPTFHFGGGYHNWEDFSSTSVASKDTVSTTTKPATTIAFSVNSPLSSTFSTFYETPRSTQNTATTSWVSLPTESTLSELHFDDVSYQGNHQEISEEEIEYQRGTTQFVYFEDTTIPPEIQDNYGEFEQSDIQPEDLRSPSNNDKSWGTKSSTNEDSSGNTFKRDEGEIPVILVRGSSRPPNNVWTPPTPPSATTSSRGIVSQSIRRRRPGSSRRPAPVLRTAVAPEGDLAALPRRPAPGTNSNSRRQQTKGRDGLGWNSFPVPLMDLSVSSDMQEMMSQLDGGSMDFMKLPARGNQKSQSPRRTYGDSPIQIDYEDGGAEIPVIPEALQGALEIHNADNYSSQITDESQEHINNANKESFKRSPTSTQRPCDHGFCDEEFLNTDDK